MGHDLDDRLKLHPAESKGISGLNTTCRGGTSCCFALRISAQHAGQATSKFRVLKHYEFFRYQLYY